METMTIDESIAHAREVAETRLDLCDGCRQEHHQLADWLTELKAYKDTGLMPKEICELLQKTQQLDNKPLTMEELREMNGEPVWVVSLGAALSRGDGWYMGVARWHMNGYGLSWLAYRQKPSELEKTLPQPMTNADRIRSMSDEELAEMLAITSPFTCIKCEEFGKDWCDTKCSEHCLKWLKQPAEVEG